MCEGGMLSARWEELVGGGARGRGRGWRSWAECKGVSDQAKWEREGSSRGVLVEVAENNYLRDFGEVAEVLGTSVSSSVQWG